VIKEWAKDNGGLREEVKKLGDRKNKKKKRKKPKKTSPDSQTREGDLRGAEVGLEVLSLRTTEIHSHRRKMVVKKQDPKMVTGTGIREVGTGGLKE